MKRNIYHIIPLLFSSIGLIITAGLLSLGFSIYQGGAESATSNYFTKDKSIISVSSNTITDWSELDEIKEKLMLDDEIIVSSESDVSLSTDIKTIHLKAMGINSSYWSIENKNILYGRLIDEEDIEHANPVMVINEKAAVDLYDTRDVLNRKVYVDAKGNLKSFTIIGVVKDPFYNQESLCFIPYNLFSPKNYKEKLLSIVAPRHLKNDIKEKTTKIMYDKYKINIDEVSEYKQLSFIDNWLDDNIVAVGTIIFISTMIGITALVFGFDNYIDRVSDRLELLKTFGISDDKIKIKLFNRLCLFEIMPLVVSVVVGYISAFVLGKYIFIKPILSFKYIIIIIGYGMLFIILAVLLSFRKLKNYDIY